MNAISDVLTSPRGQTGELDALLREALRRAIHACSKSPGQIAEELEKRLGRPIKEGLLYAWMAERKHRWHLPADAVPHLCEILKDDTMQRLLLSKELKESLFLGEDTPRIEAILQRREKRQRRTKR